jgi:hypothetical protein
MVRHGVRTSERHLKFAKMLPALPWRENGKAGLRWLENALRHQQGVPKWSNESSSDGQELPGDKEAESELSSESDRPHYVPLSVPACKALIPKGIFTNKELAYLVKSIADGTFSWEALETVDPQPSADGHGSATH